MLPMVPNSNWRCLGIFELRQHLLAGSSIVEVLQYCTLTVNIILFTVTQIHSVEVNSKDTNLSLCAPSASQTKFCYSRFREILQLLPNTVAVDRPKLPSLVGPKYYNTATAMASVEASTS